MLDCGGSCPCMQSEMFAGSEGPVLSKEEEVALRDMILSMVDEPLVLVVKLADRRAPFIKRCPHSPA